MWRYPYEGEAHGDPSVDERWRRTLNREASAAGVVPERSASMDICNAILPESEQRGITVAARKDHVVEGGFYE